MTISAMRISLRWRRKKCSRNMLVSLKTVKLIPVFMRNGKLPNCSVQRDMDIPQLESILDKACIFWIK